jgi:hypothetical protein
MSQARPVHDAATVRIVRSMNEHGAMCVEVEEDNATRHIVDYETDDLRRTLAALPEGASLPVRMEPLEDRANVWRAVGLRGPGRLSTAAAPAPGGD